MKYEVNRIIKIVLLSLLAIIILIAMIFLLSKSFNNNQKSDEKPRKDIGLIIENIKSDNANLELEYESNPNSSFKSLVYKVNEEQLKDVTFKNYKNIIIDTKTGEEITFEDMLKDNSISDFEAKEDELLRLKYPEFLVNGIKENKDQAGYKFYYVKDNEVIIFYYNYLILDEYKSDLSLKINYNEIKDCLKYKVFLDDTYENENGYTYDKDKKVIALSFDDGPSSAYNSLILEELAKNKAHATFFMVGNMMQSCQKCVVDTYKSGNEIGSHTYEHMNIKTNSLDKVNESLNKVNGLYNELTGDNIKYLRPPYGAYNKANLENATVPFILWDLDTEDWRYRNVDHIVDYILENAHDGGIILMHELYQTSYEALKVFLPKLYMMGYNVVSIGELADIKGRSYEVGKAYRSLS